MNPSNSSLSGLARSARFRRLAGQVLFVLALALLLYSVVTGIKASIGKQGIVYGYDFLWRPTGWNVSFSFVRHQAADPYWWTFVVGLLNSLTLGLLCVLSTTLFGFAIGLAMISRNYLLGLLARTFVDLFRNIPALLQVFFWYAVLKNLPGEREAYALGQTFFLSNRAFYTPDIEVSNLGVLLAMFLLVVLGVVYVRKKSKRTGRGRVVAVGLTIFSALLLAVQWPPIELQRPVLAGFSFEGGGRLSLEFLAIFIALNFYSSAFVAEIVRGGLLSVPRGQIEAARALGLPAWLVELKIRIPLGMRAILPALSNQHLFTMKLTSLGAAIGYSDLFAVTSIGINQTGQTLELLAIMVALYFLTNYALALAMRQMNKSMALKR